VQRRLVWLRASRDRLGGKPKAQATRRRKITDLGTKSQAAQGCLQELA
jgi:hypothetical protein